MQLHPLRRGTDVLHRPPAVRAAEDDGFDPAFAQIVANNADVDYPEFLDTSPLCPAAYMRARIMVLLIPNLLVSPIILAGVTKMISAMARFRYDAEAAGRLCSAYRTAPARRISEHRDAATP
ncbi:MAG: hypothetical protein EOO77_45630 [Oxalobacteraceae bacterium]|nr:MAG: hypothetical protein EOO77_45630 [Oxalobacteraceae bacterium]